MEGTLGEIRMFGGNYAPQGWATCNGQLLPINANQALFSLLGTAYGGNGSTTFALPDFRGRVPLHPGPSHELGKRAGTNYNVLQWNQLPGHTHTVDASKQKLKCRSTAIGGTQSPNPLNNYPSDSASDFSYADANTGAAVYLADAAVEVTAGTVGSNVPLENMMPSLCVNFIICVQGIYPSRNS